MSGHGRCHSSESFGPPVKHEIGKHRPARIVHLATARARYWLLKDSKHHLVEQLGANIFRIKPAERSRECEEQFLKIVERAEAQLGPGAIAHRHSSTRDSYGLDTVIVALPEDAT